MMFSKIFRQIYPAVLWTIMIFILLALPGNMLPAEKGFTIPNFDKIVHITLFGGFVMLWSIYFAYKPTSGARLIRKFIILFIIASLYGAGMEFVQKYFIPGRDYDNMDILADTIGAFIALLISCIFLKKRKTILPESLKDKPLWKQGP